MALTEVEKGYDRKWKVANREKTRAASRARYQRNAAANRQRTRNYYWLHRDEILAKGKIFDAKNAEKKRARRRRHNLMQYGLTEDGFAALWGAQVGLCAICSCEMLPRGNRSRLAAVVDHCHATGRTRGLLCGHCNRAIGMLADNPDRLRLAAAYIEKHAGVSHAR